MQLFTRAKIAMVGAEFFGTAILVLMFIILARTTAVSYFVGTSVAVTMAVVYMLFARVSGAHANPAVTFGFWTARMIGTVRGIVYITAQILGGLAAWLLYEYFVDHALPKVTAHFDWRVLIAEAIGAGILAMAFAAMAKSRDDMLASSVAIGGALFIGVMIAALAIRSGSVDPQTGQAAFKGFVNPAVALGISRFTFDWAYIVGPMVGALVGVNVYNEVFSGKGKTWVGSASKATKSSSKKRK